MPVRVHLAVHVRQLNAPGQLRAVPARLHNGTALHSLAPRATVDIAVRLDGWSTPDYVYTVQVAAKDDGATALPLAVSNARTFSVVSIQSSNLCDIELTIFDNLKSSTRC